MVHFHPSVRRLYIATAAFIATLLVFRPTISTKWTADLVLVAGLSDLLVLAALGAIFWLSTHVIESESRIGRLNRLMHFVVCCLVILVGAAAQALYIKTGEVLDLEIMSFFLGNFTDLLGATASELDSNLLLTALIAVGFGFLALLKFSRATLKAAQYLVFALPVLLLLFGRYMEPEPIDATFGDPLQKDALYQGQYRAIKAHQLKWNSNGSPQWRRGILTGISFGSAFGISEYQAIARNAGANQIYSPPVSISSATRQRRPNVLFLILESTRHDALGVYRRDPSGQAASPSNTPFIDRLADRGWIVDRAYTTIPHTSKALIGIYCGTFARFEAEISEAVPGNLPLTCLPRALSQAGYQSAHFQTAPKYFEARDVLVSNLGFDFFTSQETFEGKGWEQFGYLGLDDRAMVAPAVEWMHKQAQRGTPYFASLLTVLTHHPYASPGHRKSISAPTEALENYGRAVQYTDSVIKDLFAQMSAKGLLENTIVVITGDHGEAFGEHGQIAHNGSAHEEGMRVPLILYGPSVLTGSGRISGLRQHTDIMPTILEVAGIRHAGKLPGKSLLSDPSGHDDLISACFYDFYCLDYYRPNGQKAIFFYGKRSPEIYDLSLDPGERVNLMDAEKEELAREYLVRAARLKNSYQAVYGHVTQSSE